MVISERDAQVLEKIVKYCEEIEHAHQEYHCDYEIFCSNPTYRNAVALCLMQIGDTYTQIPWRAIRSMRNVVAHEYGKIDVETVWETAENGTLELKQFCRSLL